MVIWVQNSPTYSILCTIIFSQNINGPHHFSVFLELYIHEKIRKIKKANPEKTVLQTNGQMERQAEKWTDRWTVELIGPFSRARVTISKLQIQITNTT